MAGSEKAAAEEGGGGVWAGVRAAHAQIQADHSPQPCWDAAHGCREGCWAKGWAQHRKSSTETRGSCSTGCGPIQQPQAHPGGHREGRAAGGCQARVGPKSCVAGRTGVKARCAWTKRRCSLLFSRGSITSRGYRLGQARRFSIMHEPVATHSSHSRHTRLAQWGVLWALRQ